MALGMHLIPGGAGPSVPRDQDLRKEIAECTPELRRRAIALTGSAADASDLVQDTVERAIRSLERFQPGTNLRLWLTTIMKHLFLDGCRSARTRNRVFQAGAAVDAPEVVHDEPEVPVWGHITPEQFQAAVERLDPTMAQVFKLRVTHRLPYSEIGAQLGLPLSTVGTRLNRARLRLREILLESLEAHAGTKDGKT
jgi:RNA polymerase sigma-70 factor (ECF subfamily)